MLREDAHIYAMMSCRQIYHDFDVSELHRESKSVRDAWEVGRQLDIMMMEAMENVNLDISDGGD